VKLQRASVDVVKLGDVHKQSGRPPHLLAHLRGCSSMTKRRRRREATAALGLGFRRRVDGVATRVRIGSWGCDAALNRPKGLPWRAGQAQGRRLEADSGGGASDSAESGWDTGARKGMTRGDHLSSVAREGGGGVGWRQWFAGPAGPHNCWSAKERAGPRLRAGLLRARREKPWGFKGKNFE
jgi:hypothetical protein